MTITVDERHRRLHRKLEDILGSEETGTLMEGLTTPRLETELLRRDIQTLEIRMNIRLAELKADLLERMNEQTKTLFRTFIVTNAATVLAVATLAFGAARLG